MRAPELPGGGIRVPEGHPCKAEVRLGELLGFSACIRGNSPGSAYGRPVELRPVGPDGLHARVDEVALG